MSHTIHFPILEKLGLSSGEVLVYELLLESGRQKARDLVAPSGLGRGNVYNILLQLEAKKLVFAIQGKQTVYEAVEPTKLHGLIDNQVREVKELQNNFATALTALSSMYNLSTGKPTVQVFEGLEGFEQALNDSLSATTEILTYFDPLAVTGEIAEINRKYVKKRRNKKINKRIILPDNSAAKEYVKNMSGDFTEFILAKDFSGGFKTAMEVYNNKTMFLILDQKKTIVFIVDDPNIAALQRSQFEYIWKKENQTAVLKSPSV